MGVAKPAKKMPKQIFCRMFGERRAAVDHIEKVCRFYAGQPPKPTLGNAVCHDECSVPRRFEVPRLAKKDDEG